MESIWLLRVTIDYVVKDVSVKEMIMKRSDGDKNENEDENENGKKGWRLKKSTYKWIVDNTETWFQYY